MFAAPWVVSVLGVYASMRAAERKIDRAARQHVEEVAGVHREEAACRTPSPADPTRRNGEVA